MLNINKTKKFPSAYSCNLYMASNIIDKYYHYQNKNSTLLLKNKVKKSSNVVKKKTSSYQEFKNEQLIKDIELNLIPSLKVISIVSKKNA